MKIFMCIYKVFFILTAGIGQQVLRLLHFGVFFFCVLVAKDNNVLVRLTMCVFAWFQTEQLCVTLKKNLSKEIDYATNDSAL